MNPCCSYISQPYVFVRTVPAAIEELSAQILSAGSRYQYLNQTVHGCHPVSTVLGYVEGLDQHHYPLGVAWSEKVMSERWDSQAWLTPHFRQLWRDSPASNVLVGPDEVFSEVVLQSGILFCSFVSPLLLSRELNEYLLQLSNVLHPNNQINPAYIAPLYGLWTMNSA